MLKVTLFGTPQITLDGQSLSDLITGRRLALFIYLVTSGRAHARDVLADLLWSNTSNRKARKNLRDALPTLRRYLSEYLVAGPDTVAFNRDSYHWLDVEVFRSYVGTDLTTCSRKMLHEVLDLYQDDFLGGFYVHRAPVFEEWVLQEREQLQKLAVEGLHVLANHYLAQDDHTAGLLITKRWLTLEPWREEAHRLQMSLLAKSGQRSAALEQYATCQHVLQEEYGIDPLPETTRLYFEIKSGQFVAQRSNINRSSTVDHHHYTVKQQTSINWDAIPSSGPFYGREEQLAQLRTWVEQDRCRLITLFAVAGQGKTALITKLVHDWANSTMNSGRLSERFECILWYSLASQPTVTQIMPFFFRRLLPPENDRPDSLVEQFALLIDCLRRQRCLLVLDHVEQIMPNNESEKIAADYEMYNELWRWLAQNEHQSCLILISRIQPQELSRLECHNSAVRSLLLRGLSVEAGVTMLSESGLSADEKLLGALVDCYSGHPLALTLIRETLEELPDNEIEFFFEDGVIFDELYDLFAFERLSPAERDLLIWLAILEKPVNFKSLWSQFVQPYPKLAYLSAQRSLLRQGLLKIKSQLGNRRVQGAMTLPKIVQAYVTEHVVETITQELVSYQNTRQALGLEWLGNVLSVSGATTVTDEQEMTFSMLQKVNPNHLEQWLMEQGSGLTYLNRYLLPFPLQQSILSRLLVKWGDGCAKRLSQSLSKLQMLRSEVGYAQTNLADLLHFFFPKQKKTAIVSPLSQSKFGV